MYRKSFTISPIAEKWEDKKDKLKQKFSVLTDQDFHFEAGKMAVMFEKLQVKLGKSKEEMHKIVAAL